MISDENPLLNYFVNNSGRVIHKWVHYFEIYHRVMAPFRQLDTVRFLEVGVQNGGGAHMWRDYFGRSRLNYLGVDIDPQCEALAREGFSVRIGDQADSEFWRTIKREYAGFDIILDDGGHTMQQQLVTFMELFPVLSDGGIYICEDTHTSYMEEFGGGVNRKGTFMEFIKQLMDELHGWYYQTDEALQSNLPANQVFSIFIYDSMVIIEKRRKNPPIALAFGNVAHVPTPRVMGPRFLKRG